MSIHIKNTIEDLLKQYEVDDYLGDVEMAYLVQDLYDVLENHDEEILTDPTEIKGLVDSKVKDIQIVYAKICKL